MIALKRRGSNSKTHLYIKRGEVRKKNG